MSQEALSLAEENAQQVQSAKCKVQNKVPVSVIPES
jgi:hypothetical protein